jgi:hypothetical protein
MFRQVISGSDILLGSVLLAALTASVSAGQHASNGAPNCELTSPVVRVAELPEGSGVAVSKRSPDRLWSHNDSGAPELIALDTKGTVVGRVRVPGANVEDWEAIAVGPCPSGNCIYVADIGDNDAERRNITIYRVPEPPGDSGSAGGADVIRAMYPDGAQNAEALLVTPKGEILIVTKGDTGPVALYRVPAEATPGGTVTLQPVGKPRQSGKTAGGDRVTDGAISPSGAMVALRTNSALYLYRTEDLMSGNWQETARVSLKGIGEPQGEGLAYGDEKTFYLVGEGGGKSRPGTFGRLACAH